MHPAPRVGTLVSYGLAVYENRDGTLWYRDDGLRERVHGNQLWETLDGRAMHGKTPVEGAPVAARNEALEWEPADAGEEEEEEARDLELAIALSFEDRDRGDQDDAGPSRSRSPSPEREQDGDAAAPAAAAQDAARTCVVCMDGVCPTSSSARAITSRSAAVACGACARVRCAASAFAPSTPCSFEHRITAGLS